MRIKTNSARVRKHISWQLFERQQSCSEFDLRDGSTGINFGLQAMYNVRGSGKDTVCTVFSNGSIGEIINLSTGASHSGKGIAGLASVGGVASGVDMLAESFGRFCRTGHVGNTSIVGNISDLRNEIVDSRMGTSMATEKAKGE